MDKFQLQYISLNHICLCIVFYTPTCALQPQAEEFALTVLNVNKDKSKSVGVKSHSSIFWELVFHKNSSSATIFHQMSV